MAVLLDGSLVIGIVKRMRVRKMAVIATSIKAVGSGADALSCLTLTSNSTYEAMANAKSKTRIIKAEKLSTRRLLSTKTAVTTRKNATKAAIIVQIHST